MSRKRDEMADLPPPQPWEAPQGGLPAPSSAVQPQGPDWTGAPTTTAAAPPPHQRATARGAARDPVAHDPQRQRRLAGAAGRQPPSKPTRRPAPPRALSPIMQPPRHRCRPPPERRCAAAPDIQRRVPTREIRPAPRSPREEMRGAPPPATTTGLRPLAPLGSETTIATRALFQKKCSIGLGRISREGFPDIGNIDGEAMRCTARRWKDDRASREM
nr:serine/arginine repetitive matrix protein 1-like [Aegilops tauschii subsp. strangulata]